MRKIKEINWKDIMIRAGKTFIEAFIASIGVNVDKLSEIQDIESAKIIITPILIGGVAAGFSAIWNTILNYISNKESEVD